jgi:hypothetical protein
LQSVSLHGQGRPLAFDLALPTLQALPFGSQGVHFPAHDGFGHQALGKSVDQPIFFPG